MIRRASVSFGGQSMLRTLSVVFICVILCVFSAARAASELVVEAPPVPNQLRPTRRSESTLAQAPKLPKCRTRSNESSKTRLWFILHTTQTFSRATSTAIRLRTSP